MKTISNSQRGLALIELVVVLAVFIFLIGGAATIFVSIVQNQQRILQDQNLVNQASYMFDYISRSVRTAVKDTDASCLVGYPGYYYRATRYNATSGYYAGLKFLANDGVCQEFFLDTDGVFKEIKNGGVPQIILSDKFQLMYARFVINGDKNIQGASENDAVQPRVTMALDVKAQYSGSQKERVFQTTISQINLNVQ